MADAISKDQVHPQYGKDRHTVSVLMTAPVDDRAMAELARLRVRYLNFPGARDIQQDLDKILQQWGLTEPELFEKTREIHAKGGLYTGLSKRGGEDWS